VSVLHPNSGKQLNIGIGHWIFCLYIGTSDIGHFTRIGHSLTVSWVMGRTSGP